MSKGNSFVAQADFTLATLRMLAASKRPPIDKIYDQHGNWVGVKVTEVMSREEFQRRYPATPLSGRSR